MTRLILIVLCALLPIKIHAQQVNDRVLLIDRELGIPGHAAPGVSAVSHRFPGNITATVTEVDQDTGWLEIDDGAGNSAWIIKRYIASIVTGAAAPTNLCYRIGTWNLEHFGQGKTRGFPENTNGGPTYAARGSAELAAMARVIRDVLGIRVLVLNEINGEDRPGDGGMEPRSLELDDLIAHLGPSFNYIIARSGGSQRIALLWDQRFAELESATEIVVPFTAVRGKDIFARDPLVGKFRFIHQGAGQNDIVVVGLHLASGQHLTDNHDAAMDLLRLKLTELRTQGVVVSAGEHDIIVAGDLNASWYDNKKERFFDEMNRGSWAVLAGSNYPGTRLAGVPLSPKSQIDYIIVTRVQETERGLLGEEIIETEAKVHHELADNDWDDFRKNYSDHFPVTTCVSVIADND